MDYNKIYYNINRDEILEKRRSRYWRNIDYERQRSKDYQKKLREEKKRNKEEAMPIEETIDT